MATTIRYVGAHDAALVPAGDRELEVEHGGTVELDDELAARLLEQPENWRRADAPKTTKKGGDSE